MFFNFFVLSGGEGTRCISSGLFFDEIATLRSQ